jgi:Ca-activated chloride channel family protein
VTRALLTAGLATCTLAANAQQPSFRASADLVSIYATVTDRDNRLVTDLTREDFEVLDNGQRQELTLFSNDLQPFSAVVMIDRSGSMTSNFELVREAAATFVEHLLPGDRLRIGDFSDEIRLTPATFTNDRDVLMAVLREELQEAGAQSPVWAAVDRSITALSGDPGRRVVLIFSDGNDRGSIGPPVGVNDLIRRAEARDVMVYAIGFNITETYRVTTPLPAPVRPRPRPPILVPRPFPPGGAPPFGQWGSGRSVTRTRVRPPHPGLERLAAASGGGYFAMSSSVGLDAIFARVAEELHRQYWLGFTPTVRDGRPHQLEVRVRRSGLTVRARQEYVAER